MSKRLREELEKIEQEHLSAEDIVYKWLEANPPPIVKECMDEFKDNMIKAIVRIMKRKYPQKEFEIEIYDDHVCVDSHEGVSYNRALLTWLERNKNETARNFLRDKTKILNLAVQAAGRSAVLEVISELKRKEVKEHVSEGGGLVEQVSVPTYRVSY